MIQITILDYVKKGYKTLQHTVWGFVNSFKTSKQYPIGHSKHSIYQSALGPIIQKHTIKI